MSSDARPIDVLLVEDDPAADMHEWYGRYLYFNVKKSF